MINNGRNIALILIQVVPCMKYRRMHKLNHFSYNKPDHTLNSWEDRKFHLKEQ